MRKITEIIIHCTATPRDRHVTVEQIRECHVKQNGWNDIGYHHVIYLDGSVHEGRPEEITGAHCLGHNGKSIGIAYVGGTEADGSPADTRTPHQKRSLKTLVEKLLYKYQGATVHGHNEFAAKACPSFNVAAEFGSQAVKMIAVIILALSSTACGSMRKTVENKMAMTETVNRKETDKTMMISRLIEEADVAVTIDSAVIGYADPGNSPVTLLKGSRMTVNISRKRAGESVMAAEVREMELKQAEINEETAVDREITTWNTCNYMLMIIVIAAVVAGWTGWRLCRQKW